jgi:uncharacterized membrane protein
MFQFTIPAVVLLALVFTPAVYAIQDYYAVIGVASDDTLNVRMAPDSGAAIVGTLSHDASPVEIIRTENGWGMFPVGEYSGWVSMQFLRPIDQPMIGDTKVPEGLRCVGTEPFWSATLNTNGASASHQNWQEDRAYQLTGAARSENSFMTSLIMLEDGFAFITPGQCFDGMSDAEFGWNGYFALGGSDRTSVLHGCCALPVRVQR